MRHSRSRQRLSGFPTAEAAGGGAPRAPVPSIAQPSASMIDNQRMPMKDIRLTVGLVRFFFDEARAELQVDAFLDRGALVIALIHGTGEIDEFAIESLPG